MSEAKAGTITAESTRDICVFTPTYNRAHCLESLFESLCTQDCTNFNWLIVDDGSTDGTRELVAQLEARAPFPITYLAQKNGGKQRAHNAGVAHSESELFFCVDSDDTLVPDALSSIWACWQKAKASPPAGRELAGVIALQGPAPDKPHHDGMPAGLETTTMWDLYYKHGHVGDTAHVYRTDVLRQFPFPVAEGEKFIAETYAYHQIDQHYALAVLDKVVTIQEYLADGYTANVRKVTRENPQGYRRLKRLLVGYSDTFSLRAQNTLLYMVGCILCGETARGIADAPSKPLAILATLPAWILTKTVYAPKDRP